ncbi:MAG: alanine:cation symporter family protein, partial [Planctomycetota bacterium]
VIGRVASIIVPFMCVIYLIAAVWVLANNVAVIPEMLWLIVKNGLGIGGAAEPSGAFLGGTFGYALMWGVKRALFSSEAGQGSAPVAHSAARTDEPVREGVVSGLEPLIDTLVVCTVTALVILTSGAFNRPAAASFSTNDQIAVIPAVDEDGAEVANTWTLAAATLPPKTEEARRVDSVGEGEADWEDGNSFFVVVEADEDVNTGRTLRKIAGELKADEAGELVIEWGTLESEQVPTLVPTQAGGVAGVFRDYKGSTLTAHAFDRVTPGLGKYLVSLAVWMFAISTIISWSYYGEQGMVFLTSGLGEATSKLAILGYKLVYCVIIVVTCLPISGWLETDAAIDMWTTLGLGVMLVVNIPLMWVFAPKAMSAYHAYIGRLRRGELDSEPAPVGEKPD